MLGIKTFFFKAVWCLVLPSRGLNANKQYKIHVVFGVSRTVGNTEHRTFFFKNGTSDSSTMFLGIAIRSTIFGMNYSH
jgi:hypothetical protein